MVPKLQIVSASCTAPSGSEHRVLILAKETDKKASNTIEITRMLYLFSNNFILYHF
jgi:hypothetical protein